MWDWGFTSDPPYHAPIDHLLSVPTQPSAHTISCVFTTTLLGLTRAGLRSCRTRQKEQAVQDSIKNSVLIRPYCYWIGSKHKLWKIAVILKIRLCNPSGVRTQIEKDWQKVIKTYTNVNLHIYLQQTVSGFPKDCFRNQRFQVSILWFFCMHIWDAQ